MADYRNVLSRFPPWREEKLRAIKRFCVAEVFFYRSSVWHHSLRVHFITRELSKLAQLLIRGYEADKANILALVHDDAEMITGDIPLANKERMTDDELQEMRNKEAEAIRILTEDDDTPCTLSLGKRCYFYEELLLNALNKDCVEAQVVSYADKLDAWCESLHDLFAGNLLAVRPAISYGSRLRELKDKYPALRPLLAHANSPLTNTNTRLDPIRFQRKNYLHLGKPHTPDSVLKETEIVFYNLWRTLVLEHLGKEGMELLTVQKEFM